MSSSIQAPSRSLLRSLKSSSCQCSRSKRLVRLQQRCISSIPSEPPPSLQDNVEQPLTESTLPVARVTNLPRWAQTPPAMKAPVRARPYPRGWKPFEVNDKPEKLDAMYAKLLGTNGPKMLSDETKWLAVTHKSFDHGRRGFNDRLAFLGRRIVELQTSLGMLTAADAADYVKDTADKHGRQPFYHPATQNVEVLNGGGKAFFMHHKQMSVVAERYGLPGVARWQPKNPGDLPASGSDMVYTQALYAVVGALSLEQGGAVANRVVRERILSVLGLKSGLVDAIQQEQISTTQAQEEIST